MMKETFKNSAFYQKLVRLREDMRPMTFWQKVDHLWSYYNIYILFTAFALSLVVVFASYLSYQSTQTLVSGMMVNIYIDPEGYSYLSEDYAQRLGADDKHIVELDYANFGDLLDPTKSEDNYNQSQVLIARVSGQMLDYILLDQFAMEFYINQEVYLDLRDFFTAEELAELDKENRVIYAHQEGSIDYWAVAVDITDIAFAKDNINNEGKVYFALSGNQPNLEMCRDAWDYLHAWEPKAE